MDGTKPSRNYSYAFHFTTIGVVGDKALLCLAAHPLLSHDKQDRILRKALQRTQNLHYFADDQLNVEIKGAYFDEDSYGRNRVTVLRETGTEFMIKARKISPVKDVIDKLEAWDVDWGIMQEYEIGDLSRGTYILLQPSEKRAPRYDNDTDEDEKSTAAGWNS